MNYDNINLMFKEKLSLFSFIFKKRKIEKEIKCFHSIYFEYKFIKQNYENEPDKMGCLIFDGTYSISDNYRRYKIHCRKKRFEHLPNWIAILISLISLAVSIVTYL